MVWGTLKIMVLNFIVTSVTYACRFKIAIHFESNILHVAGVHGFVITTALCRSSG